MDEPLSSSEMLCALLDNSLGSAESSTLLFALAHDQELQAEFQQLLALRQGFQQPLLAPPEQLRAGIFEAVGLAEPARRTLAGGVLVALLSSRVAVALLSGAMGIVATLLVVGTAEHRVDVEVPAAPASTVTTTTLRPAPAANEAPQQIASMEKLPPAIVPLRESGRTAVERRDAAEHARGASSNDLPIDQLTLHPIVQGDEGSSRETSIQQRQTVPDITPVPELRRGRLDTFTAPEERLRASTPLQSTVAPLAEQEPRFRAQLRGITARSFPEFDIASPSRPLLNDIGGAAFVRLARHDAIGVEIGRENFFQGYEGINEVGGVRYEQNYLAYWGGVAYQRSFESISGLTPLVQGVLGGTGTGPMGRIMLGLQLSNGAFSEVIGVEGTMLLYRYQNNWFTTEKLGITYGIAVQF